MELGLRIVERAGGPGRVVPLSVGARLDVGRSPMVDLYLGHGTVGRRHCQIGRDGRGVWVVDYNTVNGTWLNGVRIPPGSRTPLRPCDRFQVWPVELRLVFLGPADPVWLTWNEGTVPRLARRILDAEGEEAAAPFAVLHDALLDAGCQDEEVLNHLREGCRPGRECSLLALLGAEPGAGPLSPPPAR